MKQFFPVCDEDWPDVASAGLVLVPYQPGVRCYHALRELGADAAPRQEAAPRAEVASATAA